MPNPIVRVVTQRAWELHSHAVREKAIELPPGSYEMELVSTPSWLKGTTCLWFVVKDGPYANVGGACGFWLDWCNGRLANDHWHPNFGKPIDWQEFEIQVFVNDQKLDASVENIFQTGHDWSPVR